MRQTKVKCATGEYKIECRFNKSRIELSSGFDSDHNNEMQSLTKKITKKVINLEDDVIRQALIKLGWTPPCDK